MKSIVFIRCSIAPSDSVETGESAAEERNSSRVTLGTSTQQIAIHRHATLPLVHSSPRTLSIRRIITARAFESIEVGPPRDMFHSKTVRSSLRFGGSNLNSCTIG